MGVSDARELTAHCSRAVWEQGAWERNWVSWKEGGNPAKINAFTDNPFPEGYGPDRGVTLAARTMLSFALKSTAKDDEDELDENGKLKKTTLTASVTFKIPGSESLEIPDFVDAGVNIDAVNSPDLTLLLDDKDSCQRFVVAIEKLLNANPYILTSKFVDQMYSRFANSGKEFSSDGFRTEFRDLGDSPNQARHYVGGLFAGYSLGESAGRTAANLREDKDRLFVLPHSVAGIPVPVPVILPESDSQKADKALNEVSTRHGAGLGNDSIKPYQIPLLISTEVCK